MRAGVSASAAQAATSDHPLLRQPLQQRILVFGYKLFAMSKGIIFSVSKCLIAWLPDQETDLTPPYGEDSAVERPLACKRYELEGADRTMET